MKRGSFLKLALGLVIAFSITLTGSLVWADPCDPDPCNPPSCSPDPCISVEKECFEVTDKWIVFKITYGNCSDIVALSDVLIEDNGFTIFQGSLGPGDGGSANVQYAIDQCGEITNTVTAVGYYDTFCGSESVNDKASVTCGEPCDGVGCRVTGGGVDTAGLDSVTDGYDGTLAKGKARGSKGPSNRYTFGGQAGAFTALQPQPYGEWTHHQQSGSSGRFVFHGGTASAPPGTEIDEIVCSDPGGCRPSGDPPSPAKQIDFSGVGTFKNINSEDPMLANVSPGETYHWFEVHIEDLGEPGKGKKFYNSNGCPSGGSGTDAFAIPPVFVSPALCECPDFYRIRIFEAFYPDFEIPDQDNIIYEVFGYIDGGNLQIHYPTGYDLK